MISSTSGRPIRFFIILMMGWTTIRLLSVASWGLDAGKPTPSPERSGPQRAALPPPLPVLSTRLAKHTPHLEAPEKPWFPMKGVERRFGPRPPIEHPAFIRADAMIQQVAGLPPPTSRAVATPPGVPALTSNPAKLLSPAGNTPASRWRGSAWLLWRDGSAPPTNALAAGRLGGSQAGLRVDYDLSPQSMARTFAYGRVSTALDRPASPEAAVGLGWQPSRTIPISIATERRIALGEGARDAQAFLLVGGFGPTPIAQGLEAEAYVQAGMVGLRSRDLFADGKMSLTTPIGQSPVRLGGSISGGAQPGVERLDISPEVQIRLPIQKMAARLSIEWRERIGGQAAPPSGLALTLGADF